LSERDAFMARALGAAVMENPQSTEATPALVLSSVKDKIMYRYAMPKGGRPLVCPLGGGAGQYERQPSSKVVAVVGTAHVRGIAAAWAREMINGSNRWN
jgi:pheromone shutdown protein TraB